MATNQKPTAHPERPKFGLPRISGWRLLTNGLRYELLSIFWAIFLRKYLFGWFIWQFFGLFLDDVLGKKFEQVFIMSFGQFFGRYFYGNFFDAFVLELFKNYFNSASFRIGYLLLFLSLELKLNNQYCHNPDDNSVAPGGACPPPPPTFLAVQLTLFQPEDRLCLFSTYLWTSRSHVRELTISRDIVKTTQWLP